MKKLFLLLFLIFPLSIYSQESHTAADNVRTVMDSYYSSGNFGEGLYQHRQLSRFSHYGLSYLIALLEEEADTASYYKALLDAIGDTTFNDISITLTGADIDSTITIRYVSNSGYEDSTATEARIVAKGYKDSTGIVSVVNSSFTYKDSSDILTMIESYDYKDSAGVVSTVSSSFTYKDSADIVTMVESYNYKDSSGVVSVVNNTYTNINKLTYSTPSDTSFAMILPTDYIVAIERQRIDTVALGKLSFASNSADTTTSDAILYLTPTGELRLKIGAADSRVVSSP